MDIIPNSKQINIRIFLCTTKFIVVDWKHKEVRMFTISYETGEKKHICTQIMSWK